MIEQPTPTPRLAQLEQALACGISRPIYVKRDDLMGINGGGNKLRKLEFLIGLALACSGNRPVLVIMTGDLPVFSLTSRRSGPNSQPASQPGALHRYDEWPNAGEQEE